MWALATAHRMWFGKEKLSPLPFPKETGTFFPGMVPCYEPYTKGGAHAVTIPCWEALSQCNLRKNG